MCWDPIQTPRRQRQSMIPLVPMVRVVRLVPHMRPHERPSRRRLRAIVPGARPADRRPPRRRRHAHVRLLRVHSRALRCPRRGCQPSHRPSAKWESGRSSAVEVAATMVVDAIVAATIRAIARSGNSVRSARSHGPSPPPRRACGCRTDRQTWCPSLARRRTTHRPGFR